MSVDVGVLWTAACLVFCDVEEFGFLDGVCVVLGGCLFVGLCSWWSLHCLFRGV